MTTRPPTLHASPEAQEAPVRPIIDIPSHSIIGPAYPKCLQDNRLRHAGSKGAPHCGWDPLAERTFVPPPPARGSSSKTLIVPPRPSFRRSEVREVRVFTCVLSPAFPRFRRRVGGCVRLTDKCRRFCRRFGYFPRASPSPRGTLRSWKSHKIKRISVVGKRLRLERCPSPSQARRWASVGRSTPRSSRMGCR